MRTTARRQPPTFSISVSVCGRPSKPSAEIIGAHVDQATASDRSVPVSRTAEPVHRSSRKIDDENLVDVVRGIEVKLGPRLIPGRQDLGDERGGAQPDAARPPAEQPTVGDSEVVFGFPDVEFVHRDRQPRLVGCRAEQSRQLGRNLGVLEARSWDHVQLTLPDFVEPIEAGPPAALQELVEA